MAESTPAALNAQFAIPGHVMFGAGRGGRGRVEIANAYARAQIALQGAQVLTFQRPGSAPVLFLSPHALYAPGLTTGYASWTLPGLRQAVIENDAEMVAAQLPALAERVEAATASLKAATEAASGEPQAGVAQPANGTKPAPNPAPGGAPSAGPAAPANKPQSAVGGK